MRRAAVLALSAAAVLAGCSAPPAAAVHAAPAAPPSAPAGRLLVGAAALDEAAFEQETGVRPAVVEHYTEPGGTFSAGFAGDAVPLIQVMPYNVPVTAFTSGREDPWLRGYAGAVAAYRRPVMISFAPEANGNWYRWGYGRTAPAGYIAAWRHVVTVFRAAGALNVTWVWTVNVEAAPSGAVRTAPPAAWWPGAAWVDRMGLDGYYHRPSQVFSDVFGPTLAAIREVAADPVLITETAAGPAAGQAAKIPDLFSGAEADHLSGLIWFDLKGNEDWRLRGAAALTAFRAAVRRYG